MGRAMGNSSKKGYATGLKCEQTAEMRDASEFKAKLQISSARKADVILHLADRSLTVMYQNRQIMHISYFRIKGWDVTTSAFVVWEQSDHDRNQVYQFETELAKRIADDLEIRTRRLLDTVMDRQSQEFQIQGNQSPGISPMPSPLIGHLQTSDSEETEDVSLEPAGAPMKEGIPKQQLDISKLVLT